MAGGHSLGLETTLIQGFSVAKKVVTLQSYLFSLVIDWRNRSLERKKNHDPATRHTFQAAIIKDILRSVYGILTNNSSSTSANQCSKSIADPACKMFAYAYFATDKL